LEEINREINKTSSSDPLEHAARHIMPLIDLAGDYNNETLVHEVLMALVEGLHLQLAAYYRTGGTYHDQLFIVRANNLTYQLDDARHIYSGARQIMVDPSEEDVEWIDSPLVDMAVTSGDGLFLLGLDRDSSTPEVSDGFLGFLVGTAGKVIDVSLRFRASEELRMQDSLTGLYNRRYFDEILPREISRAERLGTEFSLVLMDLDGFKSFNDLYGHQAGDGLLRKIGEVLRVNVRRIDTPMRYGGDEFAIVLPHLPNNDIHSLVTRLERRIVELNEDFESGLVVGASFGMANYPNDAGATEPLVAIADSRMYKAKRLRKADPADTSLRTGNLMLETNSKQIEEPREVTQQGRRAHDLEPEFVPSTTGPFGRRPFGRYIRGG